jgi:Asp/Glu/hydantoin racemase
VRPPRIALIHAVEVAIPPVRAAFARGWPEAGIFSLLDESLSPDLVAAGSITEAIGARIKALADYAAGTGADGILFTCSAFGPAIEAARAGSLIPILKPNEAMFDAALAVGKRIGMLATFDPSVPSMEAEFREHAARHGGGAILESVTVPEAMAALKAGHPEEHDRLLAQAAPRLAGMDAVLLAHFSTARAGDAVRAVTGRPVLTSPDSAVAALRRRVEGARGQPVK